MRRIVRTGQATADGRFAHALHVEAAGLQPDRPYWYRFTAMGERSPVGRARTAPSPGQTPDRLRFAFASCSNWERGFFSAYRHMAEERPDLVFFLGDYIYEESYPATFAGLARRHTTPDPLDLTGYRLRYAAYRGDPDLQALHAAAPCLATWDDHEVENDYADKWSEHPQTSTADFLRRRAGAYRAFYEHMPLRTSAAPTSQGMRLYRRRGWGGLAEVSILDGRQYRSEQACPTPTSRAGHFATCPEVSDPARTMLGRAQEAWLYNGFRRSRARWNIIAQDVMIAPMKQVDPATGAERHWTDAWEGYPACRGRMLDAVAQSRLGNPVFLGGDIHSYWTNDLKADFHKPDSPTIATELVGTSITSDPPGLSLVESSVRDSPYIKAWETRYRGYVSAEAKADRMEARWRVISDRADAKATVSTLKTFVVESGRAGAVQA